MIHRLTVSNFRSLGRDVRIDLGRLTVLVGQNGSGKSNITDVFQFLADCMHLGLESSITKRHGIGAVRRWSSGHPFNVEIAVDLQLPGGSGRYSFVLTGDRTEEYRVKSEHALLAIDEGPFEFLIEDGGWIRGPENLRPKVDPLHLALPLLAGDERFAPLADAVRHLAVYSIYPDTIRQPQKYDPTKPMDKHGSNWVSILKDQPDATWKPDLVAVLGKLTGDIINVRIQPVGGYLTVQFEHQKEEGVRRNKWCDAAQESDGTLRVAGMVTALRQRPAPSLIALEEPELTVHPGALRLLYDFVHECAESGSQVLLTTHSPDLLELLDADTVRVVERHDGATTVEPLEDSQRAVVREGLFSLGEVLRSEGLRQQDLGLASNEE